MPISRKPKTAAATDHAAENAAQELIAGGGAVAGLPDQEPSRPKGGRRKVDTKTIPLRLPAKLLEDIDLLVEDHPFQPSRNQWIVAAIGDAVKAAKTNQDDEA